MPFGLTRAALVVAHPGHETLLHHWLEQAQPTVFVLTDGSGGAEQSRVQFTRTLLDRTGARCGGVFGSLPDRDWYRAILDTDAAPFFDAIARIAAECAESGAGVIVCDPVELFNPMHDLANAVARAVARRIEARRCEPVPVFTYPIERPEAFDGRAHAAIRLSQSAAARKDAAILAYRPLAHEYPRYRDLATRGYEVLSPDEPRFEWPATPPEEPYYERFGRARLRELRYTRLITYADHIRPIAAELLRLDGP